MKKRILAILLTVAMCLSLLPVSTLAAPEVPAENSPTYVAQITTGEGEEATVTKYETLDEAVAAAADSATIELLADCTTAGMNLSKNLTIQAAEGLGVTPTITFTQYGIALWGKSLTFKNCNVVMNGIVSTPYTEEWNWMAICASTDASLSLDNVVMTIDAQEASNNNTHAIYFCQNNQLNIKNGSTLTIQNYKQDALEWDGGDGGYNVNITDSTFISDHNRSGFTGTFYATITKSKVDVVNSTGNGSNGSHFIIKESTVNFNDNTDHGLSAGILSIDNSTVNTLRNGANGIHTNSTLTIKNKSVVDVKNNGCKISSQWTIPGAIHIGSGDSSIDGTSTVAVQNNNGSGILLKAGTFTVSDGASFIITNNTAQKLGFGGGINNRGTISLPVNVTLYNNHAGQAGDDIYNSTNNASISFSPVDFNWALDGDQDGLDCNGVSHAIDGWYDDAENSRWEAHAKPVHVVEFADFEEETCTATVQGALALKAAHALTPLDPGDPGTENWETSKSKSATNLDKNYESQVTLSLPSAEEELVSDVVFVLDKSTSADVVTEAQNMLESLEDDVAKTGATVKVGVVIFNKEDHRVLELTELNDGNLPTINSAIANEQKIQSGTNAHAGLQEGKAMLDEDTSVDASRKYLIFVSDGITYLFDDENDKSTSIVTMQCEGRGNDAIQTPYMNYTGAALKYPYETNIFDETTITGYLDNVGKLMETDGRTYWVEYESTVTETTPALKSNKNDSGKVIIGDNAFNAIVGSDNVNDHANNLDTAIYLTNQVYQSAVSEGYHCYAVRKNDSQNSNYPWANQFMDYLANGEAVSFDGIQNDIFYLLSAGSKVTDYMGYVEDDYNFDFVNDASKLTIKVSDREYKAEKISENQYGFNKNPISSETVTNTDYDYVLTYYPGEKKNDEHFVWDINVPVINFAPVSLTYTVKLTNPQTSAGTYGEYDADGSKDYAGLYTNNSATLYPVDSNKNPGVPENFLKPTVSYTVESSGGGGGGGGGSKPPVLNTEDHFGYIIGYPEHYLTGEACHDQTLMPVKPEGNITRAEVATIFFRMLTDESRNEFWSQTSSYSDVELDDWFNNAICTLSNAGLINGYEDGSFKPNGKITRAEFATIASRFFEYADENMENPFSDVEEDTWYYRYIMAASDMGLINGYPDGTFKPDNLITRAEAVTIVNRTLDRHPDQEHFLEDMLVWPDNMDTEKWYYEDMQEATNSHEYQMKTKNGEKYEVWTKMLPIRDWEAFEKAWSDANSSNNPGEVVK